MYDLYIRNAEIFDGLGSEGFMGDVAVEGGRIVKVIPGGAEEVQAKKIIDADGLALSPGFIDSHSHSDSSYFDHPMMEASIGQGVTTVYAGQCGSSYAPVRDASLPHYEERKDVASYLKAIKALDSPVYEAFSVGHGTIRDYVMGKLAARKPTPEEMEAMKALLRRCLEEGAIGMNAGTYYAPGAYADTEELVELCKVLAEYDGVFSCHMRSEGAKMEESVEEMIEIAERSGVKTVISHHKAAGGPANWGKTTRTVEMIRKARERGLRIWCDVYPYHGCSTSLLAEFIAPIEQAKGKPALTELFKTEEYRAFTREHIYDEYIRSSWKEKGLSWALLQSLPETPEYDGRYLTDVAAERGTDEIDTLLDLYVLNHCEGRGVFLSMCEEDMETVLRQDYAMIGTDAGQAYNGHPRVVGTFPRVLGEMVRNRKLASLPQMLYRMTGLPAEVYGLKTKGVIREGMDADIVIFNKDTIDALSDFVHPDRPNVGIEYVITDGKIR